jgi:hypothetical protein
MSTSSEEHPTTKQVGKLRPCTATEALRRDLIDLQLDDDEELVLSTIDRAHQKYFARIKFSSFEDLQVLGLVPRGLRQEAVRKAIAADDEEALRLAQERVRRDIAPPCHCDHHGQRTGSFSEGLRGAFRAIRRDYNPALARVLSSHYGAEFAWDSTLAISVRGWTSRFVKDAHVTVALLRDITIGRNARLEVDATSIALLARHIRIHRTGTLSHRGGYLRIWANSIETYLLELSEVVDAESTIWSIKQ